MNTQFEYQVCRVNFHHITFVNEMWQGKDVPESTRTDEDIQACPMVWEYLRTAGREGWELVTAVSSSFASPKPATTVFKSAEQVAYQMLFLKRPIRR